MECPVTAKNIGILCRVCLTSSSNLTPLSSVVYEKCTKKVQSIHKMLEAVTFSKVTLDESKLPSKICAMCLSYLKIAIEFQMQFKNSQSILNDKIEENTKMEQTESQPPVVELICGQQKFDLNDVLVIEDEEEGKDTFEGFLKNLGSEVSARFINHKDNDVQKEQPEIVTISPVKETPCENSLDMSRLRVKKIPKESLIFIEQVDDNGVSTRIIKTLYECQFCKEVVTTKGDLESHHELHAPPEPFICDKCGHIAHSKSALYHHTQKHKGKRFKCDQCNKSYDTTSRLKVHLEVHKNEKRFLCNVCGKKFNYSIALDYHMRLHTGEKKYVCNFCGLKFRMKYTLNRHVRTHTKEKPYNCSYCNKRFSSNGEQKSHEMVHTGFRPYHCEYCGKGFIKTSNLQLHYLSHPGPHECHHCQKTFVDMNFLKIHLKKIHKEFDEDDQMEELEY